MEKPSDELIKVQTILQFTFSLVPIMAGADKFTNLLADWGKYLDSAVANAIPFSTVIFMLIVGFIEIAAGILVMIRPKIGGYIVSLWLALITLNLLATGKYFDVAIRDLVMAICAYSLARISTITYADNNKPGLVANRN